MGAGETACPQPFHRPGLATPPAPPPFRVNRGAGETFSPRPVAWAAPPPSAHPPLCVHKGVSPLLPPAGLHSSHHTPPHPTLHFAHREEHTMHKPHYPPRPPHLLLVCSPPAPWARKTATALVHEGGGGRGWQRQGHVRGVEQDGVGHSGKDTRKGEGMHGGRNGTARARTKGRACTGAKRDGVGRSGEGAWWRGAVEEMARVKGEGLQVGWEGWGIPI
jgi:hypothetical protein